MRIPPNLEDYPAPSNDPGTPLESGESWYFWEIPTKEGIRTGRIRIKTVDGVSVRVYPRW